MSRFNSDFLEQAGEGNIDACAKFLEEGLDIDCRDMNHHTPLLLALKAQKESAALFLIERGARLDVVAIDGGGPMHQAAWHGLDGAVAAMHLRGADVNVKGTRDGASPIAMAVMVSQKSTVQLLVRLGADPKVVYGDEDDSLLHLTARTSLEMLDTLDGLGLDLDAPNKAGLAPLHSMALLGKTAHVLKMLDMGADPLRPVEDHPEHKGKSAAEIAETSGHSDTAAALRAWVANKEARKTLGEMGLSP